MLCQVNLTGLTCYAYALEQSPFRIEPFVSHVTMLRAISLNMAVKKNSTKPINPSNFLWALKCSLSSRRITPLDFNYQQDVAEILQVILDELKGVPLAASSLISNTLRITVSCNTCLCSSVSEKNLDMLSLQVSTGMQTLKQFISIEVLSS